jgi:hypothetical protein
MSDQPLQPLRRWSRGDPLKADRLNEMVEAVNHGRQVAPPPKQVIPAPTGRPQQFVITGVDGDYVTAHTLRDGHEGAQTIYIAKPYLLRRTPFDGLSRSGITYTYSSHVTRQADDGSSTEDQVVVPGYVAGDVIYAVRPIGGTGVTRPDGSGGTYDVTWLDLNCDGRAWAKAAS